MNGRTAQETPTPEWLLERNRALTDLDLDYARRTVPPGYGDEFLLAVLHKARYECTTIAPDLRQASRQWLQQRGFHRMVGLPFPPEGELP